MTSTLSTFLNEIALREPIQATLPHKNPKDVPLWTRKNGNYILTIQPGQFRGELLGYPYGTIPRLLMYWLSSWTKLILMLLINNSGSCLDKVQ